MTPSDTMENFLPRPSYSSDLAIGSLSRPTLCSVLDSKVGKVVVDNGPCGYSAAEPETQKC